MSEGIVVPMGTNYAPRTGITYDPVTLEITPTLELKTAFLAVMMRAGGFSHGENEEGVAMLVVVYPDNPDEDTVVYWLHVDNPFNGFRFWLTLYRTDQTLPLPQAEWVTVAEYLFCGLEDYWNETDDLDGLSPPVLLGKLLEYAMGGKAPWGQLPLVVLPLLGWDLDEDEYHEVFMGYELVAEDKTRLFVTPDGIAYERPEMAVPERMVKLEDMVQPQYLC